MRGRRALLAVMTMLLSLPPTMATATPAPVAAPWTDTAAGVLAQQPVARPAGAVGVHDVRRGDGVERRVVRPGLAGLPRAAALAQVRDAWFEQARLAQPRPQPAAQDGGAMSGGPSSFEYVTGTVDVDGDGRRDLLVTRMDGETVRYQARAGLTGRRLWEHTAPGDYGYALTARVGPGGDRGMFVITLGHDGGDDESSQFTATTTITALAADGSTVWSQAYEGQGSSSPVGYAFQGLAAPQGVGRLTSAPAHDVLVSITDYAETPAGSTSHATFAVLDGADGSTAGSTDVVATEGFASAGVVGDLDADGLADFVTTAGQGDGRLAVAAHSGSGGVPLWQNTVAAGQVWGAHDAGDTDGDATPDVLLNGFDLEEFEGTLHVISGADGSQRWTAAGETAVAVRDVNGDGLRDVAVQGTTDHMRMAAFGARYRLLSGTDGAVLYHRSYTVKFGDGGGMGMLGLYGVVGDADGDRRPDMAHELQMMSFDGKAQDNSGVVRSRDGIRTLRRSIGTPLHTRVDRRGDDFALVDTHRGLLRLRVRDGRTGKRVWRRFLPKAADAGSVMVTAADVTRDRRAELIVVVPRRSGNMIYVLKAGRGTTLWRG